MLSHSGPLVLAHCLLYVVVLPFGYGTSEDCELMQLKTVLESSPQTRMPSCGHLTIYSSPRVTLVHLPANLIRLGLWVTRQAVPQLLVHIGNSLVMSLLAFLEHLLGMCNLHLAGLLVILGSHTLGLGGPAPKPFLSVLIYSTRCEYDILNVFLKKNSSWSYLGFLVVCHLC
jgi:hypothetical protein